MITFLIIIQNYNKGGSLTIILIYILIYWNFIG